MKGRIICISSVGTQWGMCKVLSPVADTVVGPKNKLLKAGTEVGKPSSPLEVFKGFPAKLHAAPTSRLWAKNKAH